MGERQKTMNRMLLLVAAAAFLVFGLLSGGAVYADEPLNPDEVQIYFLEEEYVPYTGELPADCMTEYQIRTDGLEGTPKYTVISGSSCVVTADGVIRPRTTTWYYKNGFGTTAYMEDADRVEISYSSGTSKVRVTCGDFTQEITVVVSSYSNLYVERRVDAIIDEVITPGMTDLEKLTAVTKWVGDNTDYSSKYASAKKMLIYNCGDCWASTNTILEFCEKLGIEAKDRRGNQDAYSGSGHRNVIARCEGKYYVAEAGYTGSHPRGYNVKEEVGGFSVGSNGDMIYQYDGFDPVVEIPEEINGKTITQIGNGRATVFPGVQPEYLYIPATISLIRQEALYGTSELTDLAIDSSNQYYEKVGSSIYTKDRSKLVFTLRNASELVIDPKTTEICSDGANDLTLDELVIPSTVKKLDYGCFYGSKIGRVTVSAGIETLDKGAFGNLTTDELVIPEGITSYGEQLFASSHIKKITLASDMSEIPASSFHFCGIEELKIHDGVTSIGQGAFCYCYYLNWISIPKSLTSIGENAFSSCNSLKNIYYDGTEEEWAAIEIQAEIPAKTIVHFNSVRATGIKLEKKEIELKSAGETYELSASVLPSNASNKKISYTSSNASVAKVSENVLTAVKEGECEVTATSEDGSFQAVYSVVVKYPRYTLTVDGGTIQNGTYMGESEGVYLEKDYVILTTDYSSSDGLRFQKWVYDEDISLYSSTATSTTIRLYMPAHDTTVRAEYEEIKVSTLYSINCTKATICPGEEEQLSATVIPSTAYNKKVSWSSSDESVLTVDENGKIRGIAAGQATITAQTTDGTNLTKTREITVREHDRTNERIVTPAGCETTGICEYTCSYCGAKVQEEIPAKGHTAVVDPGVKATTHSTGLTKGAHCSECGKILKKQKTIPMLPTGWVDQDGNRYYYSQDGVPVTGLKEIEGKKYYFNSKGVMQTGWITKSGKTFYFDANGVMATGLKKIQKKYYYFSKKGVMTVGWLKVKGKTYYFDAEGVMVFGWAKIDSKWYYFDTKGAMTVGWFTMKGKTYYFDAEGVMAINCVIRIDGKKYGFDAKGVCKNPPNV